MRAPNIFGNKFYKSIKKLIKVVTYCAVGKLYDYYLKNSRLQVVILMFHSVNNDGCKSTVMSPSFFEQLVKYISENKKVISMASAVQILKNKSEKGLFFVLTFDDGYSDNLHIALPILEKYNVNATVFVTTNGVESGALYWDMLDGSIAGTSKKILSLEEFGFGVYRIGDSCQKREAIKAIHTDLKYADKDVRKKVLEVVIDELGACGKRVIVDESELIRLAESLVVEIGSHGVTHEILSKLNKNDQFFEVFYSKDQLESMIMKDVCTFAYPNGGALDYSPEVVKLVEKAGYAAACTTKNGINTHNTPIFELKRIDMTEDALAGGHNEFSPLLFEVQVSSFVSEVKRSS